MYTNLSSFFWRRTLLTVGNSATSAAAISLNRAASTLTRGDEECVVPYDVDVAENVLHGGNISGSGRMKYGPALPAPLQSALADNVKALGQIPTHEEIVTVLDTLFEQPERLLKLLSPNQLQTLRSNPDLVADQITSIYETSTACTHTTTSCRNHDHKSLERQLSWSELTSQHACVICMDVLAAPVITNCGHSYCGECLASHMESCASLSNDVEVVHPCPTCRAEITSITYERGYDASIAASVAQTAASASKNEYYDRREAYHRRRQQEPCCSDHEYDEAGVMFVMGLAVAVLALIVIEIARCYRRK